MTSRILRGGAALAVALVFAACSAATAAPAPESHRIYTGNLARDTGTPVADGPWGGDRIQLEVAAAGAAVEFDCAHGTIGEPLLLNAAGQFSARGEFVREHGGPIRDGDRPDAHPAVYTGAVDGNGMTLTIALSDNTVPATTYRLTRGKVGTVVKCL